MFRKILIVLMVVCFLLGMATRKEKENLEKTIETTTTAESTATEVRESAETVESEYFPLIKPEEEPALYKTELSQVTPKMGITTGHVIAYGHYIKPPYKLEVREDTLLFVNGIRIYPTLPSRVAEEYHKRLGEKALEKLNEEDLAIYKRHEVFFEEVKNVYKEVNARKGREQALDSVLKLLKKDTLIKVVDTVFGQTGGVVLGIKQYLPGIAESWGLSIDLDYSYKREAYAKLSPYFQKKIKERAKNRKESLEKDLRKGRMAFCTSFNSAIIIYWESEFHEIFGILESKEFSLNEKINRLSSVRGIVGSESRELVYNFNPSEWPLNKKAEE